MVGYVTFCVGLQWARELSRFCDFILSSTRCDFTALSFVMKVTFFDLGVLNEEYYSSSWA